MTYVQLYQKYQTLPPDKQAAVDEFVEFLTAKQPVSEVSEQKKTLPVFGSAKGLFHMTSDFDAPLDDFTDYQ